MVIMGPAIDISDDAMEHISQILRNNPGKHLRVGINDRGCSGHKYQYDLRDWDDMEIYDEVIDWPMGRMVIDGHALMFMIGSRLELRGDQFSKQLVWENPFAHNQCGCGESFQIKPCGSTA